MFVYDRRSAHGAPQPTMRQALQEEALARPLADCRIVPAELGEEIGNYASVAVARYRKGDFAE